MSRTGLNKAEPIDKTAHFRKQTERWLDLGHFASCVGSGFDEMTKRALLLAVSVGFFTSLVTGAMAREEVTFREELPVGTIVVKQKEKRLYFVTGEGKAVRYKVAVGKPGKQWNGTAAISSKHLRPAWTPPQEVKRDKPSLQT